MRFYRTVSKIKDRDIIFNFIKNGYECEYLDFKKTQYNREKFGDLLVDIISMVNSHYNGDKYIIIGVKDKPDGTREVIGVEPDEFIDDSVYQNLIFDNVEPHIKFDYYSIEHDKKLLGVFKIYGTNIDRPYMLRKKYPNLNEGLCKIRRGSSNCFVTRKDIDKFFNDKEKFEVQFIDNCLAAIYDELGYASITVTIRNHTKLPVVISSGVLTVLNEQEQELSIHAVSGFEKKIMGAEFQIDLPPMSEKLGDLLLCFRSSDCIRLGLDEYGHTNEKFKFLLSFFDTNNNEYTTYIDDGWVLAKGKFLWKVELAAKKNQTKRNNFFNI